MKKVLSLLVAFVFLQVQSWALSGGPDYSRLNGSQGNPSIIGTYGGVLIPKSTTFNTAAGAGTNQAFQPATIGLFSISVPETGISSGVCIMFVDGLSFIGQIAGMGDVDKQTIQGVIGATSSFQIKVPLFDPVTGTVTFQSFDIFAQGSFKANVVEGAGGAFTKAPPGSGNGTSASGGGSSSSSTSSATPNEVGSTNAARLTGKAQVGSFFTTNDITGEPNINVLVDYEIDGIKQNNIPNNVNTVSFTFGANNTGG